MKIFPTACIKRIDAYTIEHEPIPSLLLMERAASVLTKAIRRHFPQGSFAIFAGAGNNGGDALAVARMLAVAGRKVDVWLVAPGGRLSPDCEANRESLQAMALGGLMPVTLNIVEEGFAAPSLAPDVIVVEGLFGSGLNRPVTGLAAEVIRHINSLPNEVVAIDIPSGLMGEDNGCNIPENIIRASLTLTLQFPKLAMLFAENAPYVGRFEVLDIGLSREAVQLEPSPYSTTDTCDVASLVEKRPRHAHKGTFGRLLLVAGSEGMAGASVLAARAALRSGVGLLTIALPAGNNDILQRTVPEAMTLPDACTTHISHPVDTARYTAVAVGPGLAQHPDTEKALLQLIERCTVPMIVDADALNILSRNKEYLSRLPRGSVITPHIGELERLVGKCGNSFERLQRAVELARENNICVVLKGAYTAVVTPQGCSSFNCSGNAGMATGGSGDVLTGVVAALLARGFAVADAARLGVYVHGAAGDLAAEKMGETALIASDIVDALPRSWQNLETLSAERR